MTNSTQIGEWESGVQLYWEVVSKLTQTLDISNLFPVMILIFYLFYSQMILLKWISFSGKFLIIYVTDIKYDQRSLIDDSFYISGKCVDNRNGIHFKFDFALKTVNVSGGFHWKYFPNFCAKFNSFYAKVTFRFPLKTSEKLRYRFQGVYKWNTDLN